MNTRDVIELADALREHRDNRNYVALKESSADKVAAYFMANRARIDHGRAVEDAVERVGRASSVFVGYLSADEDRYARALLSLARIALADALVAEAWPKAEAAPEPAPSPAACGGCGMPSHVGRCAQPQPAPTETTRESF